MDGIKAGVTLTITPIIQHARNADFIKTLGQLCRACWDDWKMKPNEILKICNVDKPQDITDFAGAYRKIALVKNNKKAKGVSYSLEVEK